MEETTDNNQPCVHCKKNERGKVGLGIREKVGIG